MDDLIFEVVPLIETQQQQSVVSTDFVSQYFHHVQNWNYLPTTCGESDGELTQFDLIEEYYDYDEEIFGVKKVRKEDEIDLTNPKEKSFWNDILEAEEGLFSFETWHGSSKYAGIPEPSFFAQLSEEYLTLVDIVEEEFSEIKEDVTELKQEAKVVAFTVLKSSSSDTYYNQLREEIKSSGIGILPNIEPITGVVLRQVLSTPAQCNEFESYLNEIGLKRLFDSWKALQNIKYETNKFQYSISCITAYTEYFAPVLPEPLPDYVPLSEKDQTNLDNFITELKNYLRISKPKDTIHPSNSDTPNPFANCELQVLRALLTQLPKFSEFIWGTTTTTTNKLPSTTNTITTTTITTTTTTITPTTTTITPTTTSKATTTVKPTKIIPNKRPSPPDVSFFDSFFTSLSATVVPNPTNTTTTLASNSIHTGSMFNYDEANNEISHWDVQKFFDNEIEEFTNSRLDDEVEEIRKRYLEGSDRFSFNHDLVGIRAVQSVV